MYGEKTGSPFERNKNYKLFYFPERGFCEVAADVEHGIVVINQLCGDARFWRRMVECLASSMGIECCGTFCLRHIKPFIRLFGFRIVSTEECGGYTRYHGIDEYGCRGTATPYGLNDDTGNMEYMITWEVPKQDE